MDKSFGGIIWTNHAIDRMRERGIKQGDAWATWNHPEQSYKGAKYQGQQAWRYYRTYGDERIEVVAAKNGEGKWVVISVWSKPVFTQSSKNQTHPSKKVSFWRWLYNTIYKV